MSNLLALTGDVHPVFDEEAGTLTGVPPRRQRRGESSPERVDEQVVAFLEQRFPTRMAKGREVRARTRVQIGVGYRNNILVRLIVNTFTDLGLGTQGRDMKSREVEWDGSWITVTTADVILTFGMALSTFSSTRSHVELCYRVRQWMVDNPRQWDSSEPDSEEQRLFDMLEAFCRRGVLPSITSHAGSTLTRAERDALLCAGRAVYETVGNFVKGHSGMKASLQHVPVTTEPEE